MDEEIALYAPMVIDDTGRPRYRFPQSHPAFGDDDYRARRDRIALQGIRHQSGDPAPTVDYAEADHDTWRRIVRAIRDRHAEYAADEVVGWFEELALPADHVPQLAEVSDKLDKLSGFRFVPAVGFVPIDKFYGLMAEHGFYAAQFIRHHSRPLFSPEADVVHELIGHGPALANASTAELYRLTGEAVRRVALPRTVELISRVFWFTLEYGVVTQRGRHHAYGAGLLSSYGELECFREATIRPLDLAAIGRQDYDITSYQQNLFTARSIDHAHDFFAEFLTTVDDDAPDRLGVTF